MASIKRPKVELPFICEHPGDIAGICVNCGGKLDNADDPSRVSLNFFRKNLRVSNLGLLRIRSKYSNNLLRRKKLCLVLDLDHTLLNSSFPPCITSHHEQCFNQASPNTLFRFRQFNMMTKLRPFVRTFLKEATNLFDMFIYTMGNRNYALMMAKLLDPEGIYFNSRIISRDDSPVKERKSLDVVFGQEKAVIIVDDTRVVWENHLANLIEIEKYQFFALDRFPERRCDESESDGPLASVLEILKGVHGLFFDEESKVNLGDRDVREVLKTFKENQTFSRKRKKRSSSSI